jgi:hypothetical protein
MVSTYYEPLYNNPVVNKPRYKKSSFDLWRVIDVLNDRDSNLWTSTDEYMRYIYLVDS